jgi:hypothetical protein
MNSKYPRYCNWNLCKLESGHRNKGREIGHKKVYINNTTLQSFFFQIQVLWLFRNTTSSWSAGEDSRTSSLCPKSHVKHTFFFVCQGGQREFGGCMYCTVYTCKNSNTPSSKAC